MQAYCFKCHKKIEIKNPQITVLKNKSPATRGVCPACGTNVFRLGKLVESPSGVRDQPDPALKIKLNVINVESGETWSCTMNEAKSWDWNNHEIAWLVNGYWQVTSWDQLVETVRNKIEKGCDEVTIYENRLFFLAGGG